MSLFLDPVVLLIGALIVFLLGLLLGIVWENQANVYESLPSKQKLFGEETTLLGVIFFLVLLFYALCWLLLDKLKTFCLWLWGSWRGMASLPVVFLLVFVLAAKYSGSLVVVALFFVFLFVACLSAWRVYYLCRKFPKEIKLPNMMFTRPKAWKHLPPPEDTNQYKPK